MFQPLVQFHDLAHPEESFEGAVLAGFPGRRNRSRAVSSTTSTDHSSSTRSAACRNITRPGPRSASWRPPRPRLPRAWGLGSS